MWVKCLAPTVKCVSRCSTSLPAPPPPPAPRRTIGVWFCSAIACLIAWLPGCWMQHSARFSCTGFGLCGSSFVAWFLCCPCPFPVEVDSFVTLVVSMWQEVGRTVQGKPNMKASALAAVFVALVRNPWCLPVMFDVNLMFMSSLQVGIIMLSPGSSLVGESSSPSSQTQFSQVLCVASPFSC